MKTGILILLFNLLLFPLISFSQNVTATDILAEKYSKELFPEKFEYIQHIEKYKQAVKAKRASIGKLDSLAMLETLPMWPEEEQQKFKHIIHLAKNDSSGDTYNYIRELGADYAFTLNKIINLNELYVLERVIAKAHKDLNETQEWAERVAKIANYFYEDFIADTLDQDMFYYGVVLYVEDEIAKVGKKYNNDIGLFLLDNEEKAKSLYYTWRKWKPFMKPSPAKEFLFIQLEKRFTRTFSN